MASGVLNSWSQIRRELEYCRYPYWRIHPSEVKSLGLPGRALGEPISGDVGDVLRYWVYHGLPHDSGDPLFGGSESRLPSPFVCFSLQLIETWFLVHVTFFHGSLTLCGELWMPTKRIWGMEYGWYWWLNHQRIKISPKWRQGKLFRSVQPMSLASSNLFAVAWFSAAYSKQGHNK